jgi:hypothetical protein
VPAWPAELIGVAQPATRRMQARTPLVLVACIRLRLVLCGRLLGTASCRHLAYHGGQDGVGMLPADQVEAFEGFVCESSECPLRRVQPVGPRSV